MVVYMDKASIEALTVEDLKKLIYRHSYGDKYRKLQDYYCGKHAILQAEKADKTGGDNRIVNNMARYITDTATGYFVGQPVAYSSGNDAYMETLQDILDYNDEQDHNMELAKQCSIKGDCFEMLYLDEEGKIRFGLVFPENLIMFYETEAEFTQPLAALRLQRSFDKNGNLTLLAEFWTASRVVYLKSVSGAAFEVTGYQEHYWQDVPFVEYVNNFERLGDFEGVISEIDAYNRVQSNTANYFQYNDDAILKILRLGDVSDEDIAEMKKKRAIILEDGGDVDWLLKEVNDTALENYKTRLLEDIHAGANVPNLNDDAFGGQLSGIAISYKLWGLEQLCVTKERKFKRALQRRIELITNMLSVKGQQYDYRDIDLRFRRNKPQDVMETAQIVSNLQSMLSKETLLQLLPFVDDVDKELKKQKAEQQEDAEAFGNYQNFAKAFRTEEETDETTAGETAKAASGGNGNAGVRERPGREGGG